MTERPLFEPVKPEAFEAALRQDAVAVRRAFALAFKRIGVSFVGRAQGRIVGEYGPGRSKMLRNRSGNLRRDGIRFQVTDEGPLRDLVLGFYLTRIYGATQEFGNPDLRPKRAKWLTIPAEENMNPSGLTITSPRDAINAGAFFYRPKTGKADRLWIVRQVPGGGLEVLFRLRRSVSIPPRWGLRKEFSSKGFERYRLGEYDRAIKTALS